MTSHSHFHFDLGVAVVIDQLEVLELEVFDVLDVGIDFELREWVRVPLQLLFERFDVVLVDMCIAQTMYEFTTFQSTHLCQHACQ